jgi:hypothetical protein
MMGESTADVERRRETMGEQTVNAMATAKPGDRIVLTLGVNSVEFVVKHAEGNGLVQMLTKRDGRLINVDNFSTKRAASMYSAKRDIGWSPAA